MPIGGLPSTGNSSAPLAIDASVPFEVVVDDAVVMVPVDIDADFERPFESMANFDLVS